MRDKPEFKSIKAMGLHTPLQFGHRKDTVRRIFDTAGKADQAQPNYQQFWKDTHRYCRPCDHRRSAYVVNYVGPTKGAAFRAYNSRRGHRRGRTGRKSQPADQRPPRPRLSIG